MSEGGVFSRGGFCPRVFLLRGGFGRFFLERVFGEGFFGEGSYVLEPPRGQCTSDTCLCYTGPA